MNLHNNFIDIIGLFAFIELRALETLTLSRNFIKAFDKRIFERNTKLTQLNLAQNNFWALANIPLIQSQSIRELNLSNCHISYLHMELFRELPQLQRLDMSNNLLLTIQVAAFERNLRMEVLQLDGNPFTCDLQMEMTLLLLRRQNIRTGLKHCREYIYVINRGAGI